MNWKFGKYWGISKKDLLKFCQKLENSVKASVKIELILITKDV